MRRLVLLLTFAIAAAGAIPTTAAWEARDTGATNNSACFVPGLGGTDYSQQNAAQYTFTDLVLVTATTASSVSHSFVAADVGNCVKITAGTGFTVGYYEIASAAAGVATLDRAAGTMGSTGGTYFVGGAAALPTDICAAVVDGNTVWMKGTFTVTVACNLAETNAAVTARSFIGYTTTRGDNGRATWTTATSAVTLVRPNSATVYGINLFNFNFSNTAASRANCIDPNGSGGIQGLAIQNATFDGCATAINLNRGVNAAFTNVEVKNSTVGGIICGNANANAGCTLFNVYVHNNTGIGVLYAGTNGMLQVTKSTISNNTSDNIQMIPGTTETANCFLSVDSTNIYTSGANGINLSSAGVECGLGITNTIVYGNTLFGVTSTVVPSFQYAASNAYGSNGSGARSNFNAGTGDVALTANPFTAPASGNYALNATAGGGAAVKAAGFPGVSLFGTGFLSIGALQSSGAATLSVGIVN